jgi:hypothetical protein
MRRKSRDPQIRRRRNGRKGVVADENPQLAVSTFPPDA